MRKLILLAGLLILLPGIASAQPFIRYYPPSGVAELTSSGTAITSTVPISLPAGSASATSLNFGTANTGFYGSNADFRFAIGGTLVLWGDSTAGITANRIRFNFASSDTFIGRGDAANDLQLGSDAATAANQTLSAADSTGASQTGAQLQLAGGTGGAGGEPGAVAIVDGGTKPTCAAGIRGSIWYDAGGAGVADTFEVCAKQAAGDSYAWRALATIP